ncbi:MAG: DUF1843 domain-containing protein [Calothrix sp. MO_192.B10]|nr:DUF1843 domain-containing protein [Calothrix sp. MO_192.B10]
MAVQLLYAVAIHECAASGDMQRMKAMVQQAEEWLREAGDVSAALELLKLEIVKLERNG